MKTKIWIVIVMMCLSACAKKSSSSAADSASSGGGSDTSPVDPIPSSSTFYVHAIPEEKIETYTHVISQNWDQKCKVNLDAATTAERDIMCVVEMQEGDMHYTDLILSYNIPVHPRCRYIRVMPYYFYFAKPGDGPDQVAWTEDTSGRKTITGFSGGSSGATAYVGKGNSINCSFDYSGGGGPNCCEGEYTATITIGGVASTEQRDWGGSFSNCTAGPAVDLQSKTEDGFPRPDVYRLVEEALSSLSKALFVRDLSPESAVSIPVVQADASPTPPPDLADPPDDNPFTGEMKLQAPADKAYGSNIYTANYYEDLTNLPKPVSYPDATLAPAYKFPWPYYTYDCVDEAEEVYARIRIMIRDWNSRSEFIKTSNTADANVSGSEPGFSYDDYNDHGDWKDYQDLNLEYPGIHF
jgi:hypothetical protein